MWGHQSKNFNHIHWRFTDPLLQQRKTHLLHRQNTRFNKNLKLYVVHQIKFFVLKYSSIELTTFSFFHFIFRLKSAVKTKTLHQKKRNHQTMKRALRDTISILFYRSKIKTLFIKQNKIQLFILLLTSPKYSKCQKDQKSQQERKTYLKI